MLLYRRGTRASLQQCELCMNVARVPSCPVLRSIARVRCCNMLAASISSCTQVWYSVGWDTDTRAHFLAAVQGLQEDASLETAVHTWLHMWSESSVALRAARKEWLRRAAMSHAAIADLLLEEDQIAVCRYAMAGTVQGLYHSTL